MCVFFNFIDVDLEQVGRTRNNKIGRNKRRRSMVGEIFNIVDSQRARDSVSMRRVRERSRTVLP